MLEIFKSLVKLILLAVFTFTVGACGAPWDNPPNDFQGADLAGTWSMKYTGNRYDTLVINPSGTFRQVYREMNDTEEFEWDSGEGIWFLEELPSGHVRLHLEGGRYYPGGQYRAEKAGLSRDVKFPWPFYDPFVGDSVYMPGELVLQVRSRPSGDLILHHLSSNIDGGSFGIFKNYFQRVEEP